MARVERKTLWNVKSATTGGSWELSALGGLLNGVIYIDSASFNGRQPKGLYIMGDKGTEVPTNDISGATIGDVSLKLDGEANGLLVYVVTSTDTTVASEGLYQIDAQFTTNDSGSGGDGSYTKDETDKLLHEKVDVGSAPKVSKGTANSTRPVNPLATDADLAAVIAKVNEIASTLNTVRSTAGAGLIAANGLIDSLTTSTLMPK